MTIRKEKNGFKAMLEKSKPLFIGIIGICGLKKINEATYAGFQ